MNHIFRSLALLPIAIGNIGAQDFWMPISNGPYGQGVQDMVIGATNKIFAATWGTGIFCSTDDGVHWQLANNGLNDRYVYSAARNPQGCLFAGTLDPSILNGRVYRSTDDGLSWSSMVDLRNGVRTLFVASNNSVFAGTSGGGVYRSTDDGEVWEQINIGLGDTSIQCFAVNSMGYIFAGGAGRGLNRSMDNGDSWIQVDTAMSLANVTAIAVGTTGFIFAGTPNGVFRSEDDGLSWTPVNSNVIVRDVEVWGDSMVLAGCWNGVHRSTDNGNSWTAVNSGLTDLHIRAFSIDSMQRIHVVTDGGGFFLSTNLGDTWTHPITGLADPNVRSITVNSYGHVFVGSYFGGVFRSTNDGYTWSQSDMPFIGHRVYSIHATPTGVIFAGTATASGGGTVFRSMDNGETWDEAATGLPNSNIISIGSVAGGDVFVGTYANGIYRSTDNGDSWSPAGLGGTILSITSGSDSILYVGTESNGVFMSTDVGSTWKYSGLIGDVYAIVTNGAGHVFATPWSSGIYRSTNNGDTWVQINNGLSDTYVNSLVVNPEGHIFAGMSFCCGGANCSTDNGDSWTSIVSGLPTLSAEFLATTPSGYIYVGTLSRGLFRSIEPTVTSIGEKINPIPETFSLSQNYPNPFNPTTVIGYHLTAASQVSLKVYNVLGQEVATLVDGRREAGDWRQEWRADGVASGVYFYRLTARALNSGEVFVSTKKMLLVR